MLFHFPGPFHQSFGLNLNCCRCHCCRCCQCCRCCLGCSPTKFLKQLPSWWWQFFTGWTVGWDIIRIRVRFFRKPKPSGGKSNAQQRYQEDQLEIHLSKTLFALEKQLWFEIDWYWTLYIELIWAYILSSSDQNIYLVQLSFTFESSYLHFIHCHRPLTEHTQEQNPYIIFGAAFKCYSSSKIFEVYINFNN